MTAPVRSLVCPVKVTGQRYDLFGLKARWLRFAEEVELRRLAKLHLRIERRKKAIASMHAERLRIMDRCVKRMERAKK